MLGTPLRLSVFLVLLCASFARAGAGPGFTNILFYGNSFTLANGGIDQVVRLLAQGENRPVRTVNAAVSNTGLDYHRNYNTEIIATGLPDGEFWHKLVLQDLSLRPTRLGHPAAMRREAVLLAQRVMQHSPGVDTVLFETWARAPQNAIYIQQAYLFPAGAADMQSDLSRNYHLARADMEYYIGPSRAHVARVGEAWQLAGWDGLFAADLYHPSPRGTIFAGLVIYAELFNVSVSSLNLQPLASRFFLPLADVVAYAQFADQARQLPAPPLTNWVPMDLTIPPPPPPPPPVPPPPEPVPPPYCPEADYNLDGSLDPDDLGDFINAYFAIPVGVGADVNNDGEVNPDDLGDFLNVYFGCH